MSTSQSPRRILLAVTGLTPQVVTETLYALACTPQHRWIPDEIHLITTATGAENARLNLLRPEQGWFHRLCRDYSLPPIHFPAENIHILRTADGAILDDIRTQEQNTLAADFITEKVRTLTNISGNELHVSIAGGRKTMGYYLGYALSLYGRQQDRLSHVLVSDPYETNREFYYPTPYEHPIHSRRGDKEITVDAHNARVELASIPFVRLRDGLPERLRQGKAEFSQVVSAANRAQESARLTLAISGKNPLKFEVHADDEPIAITDTEFAVLLWLAERNRRGERTTEWGNDTEVNTLRDEFMHLAKKVLGNSNRYDAIAEALRFRTEGVVFAKYFEPHKSNINKKFTEILGKAAANRYTIKKDDDSEAMGYCLDLAPAEIEIITK